MKVIRFRTSVIPSDSTLSTSVSFSAFCSQTAAHAPQRAHMVKDGSPISFFLDGSSIPLFVTTRIASVGHFSAQDPSKIHFSGSLTSPSAAACVAGPHVTSSSIASTGHSFSQSPHAAHTSGRLMLRSAPFAFMKSPGHASTQVLHPIQSSLFTVKLLIVFPLLVGMFSLMNTASHGQVCEQIPHLIHVSSSIVIGSP